MSRSNKSVDYRASEYKRVIIKSNLSTGSATTCKMNQWVSAVMCRVDNALTLWTDINERSFFCMFNLSSVTTDRL